MFCINMQVFLNDFVIFMHLHKEFMNVFYTFINFEQYFKYPLSAAAK